MIDDESGQEEHPYVLYYEDARGALLFDDRCAPYVIFAGHDGDVHVVDAGADAVAVRTAVAEARPANRDACARARRDGRRRRRFMGAAAAGVATIGFVVVPGLGGSVAAQEKPAKVLQAVDITLGADGSLTAVSSNDVRNTEGEGSSKSVTLDPNKVAGSLPVRVLTSYVHDGRTGTDLEDLKGARGRVEITITVQNATVHAEKLSYDVAGSPRERYALIGTPLTVTASAVLSDGTLVLPRHNVAEAATNGVVGRNGDGDTTVQWVAMLAPPRLATSASFTLVQESGDFHLPEFDLTVQPGLVTDPSVDRLIRDAFRKDGTSQLSLESKTVVVISTVSRILGEATQTLEEIQAALRDGSDNLGSQLVQQLATSSTQLTDAAGELSASLEQLDAGLTASMETTRDENVAALRKTVRTLSDYIGHADDTPIEPLPVTPGCGISTKGAAKATTLYGQLKNVSRELLTLKSATKGCLDTIKAAIDASLGDPTNCPPGAGTAACTLVSTKAQLEDVASYVATAGGALLAQFDPTAVDGVRTALDALTEKVVSVQNAAARLNAPAGGSQADSLKAQLEALVAKLDVLIASVEPGGAGLGESLDALNDLAEAHRTALGADDGAVGSIAAQLAAAAAAVCETPAALVPGDQEATDYLDRLRAILVGTSCAKSGPAAELPVPTAYPTPLSDRLALEYQAWTTVASLTDTASPAATGPAREAKELGQDLVELRDDITSVIDALGGTGDSLKTKMLTLQSEVAALYTAPAPAGCVPTDAQVSPLNVLHAAFTKLECNQDGLGDNLAALLASATPTYAKAATDVGAAATVTDDARLDAAHALDDLLGTLNTSLADAAQSTLDEGGAVIEAQQAALTDREDAFVAALDSATQEALEDIGTSIGESNRLLATSTDLLKKGLEAVQADLGQGGATPRGLLGVVSSSANETGAAGDSVGDASSRAAAFGRVRGSEVEDVLLQQAQLTRALELQAVFPPFGIELPPGSTSTVVFSFHLEGV